jgi:hypothetical protein
MGAWSRFPASDAAHQGDCRHGHQDRYRHLQWHPLLRGLLLLHHRFVVQPRFFHRQNMGLVSTTLLFDKRRKGCNAVDTLPQVHRALHSVLCHRTIPRERPGRRHGKDYILLTPQSPADQECCRAGREETTLLLPPSILLGLRCGKHRRRSR